MQTDLNNNTVAQYNLITPNQYNDMHSSLNTDFTYNGVTYAHNTDQQAIAIGDNFLSQIVPTIMASQAYKNNGVIVIWFDETEGGNTTAFTLPEIVISPLAKGNAYDSTLAYTHSSDLKSMQELFGVSAPGGGFLGDANTPGTNDLSDMFVPGVFTPSTLAGTVFKNSGNDHQVEAGLTVVLTGVNDAGQDDLPHDDDRRRRFLQLRRVAPGHLWCDGARYQEAHRDRRHHARSRPDADRRGLLPPWARQQEIGGQGGA